jgi:hypothetical protein
MPSLAAAPVSDGSMKPSIAAGLLVLGLLAGACARPPPQEPEAETGQSFAEALTLICDVDRRAGIADDADPLERIQQREEWLSDQVKNPDAIYFRTLLKVQGPVEKAAALEEEARKLGILRCALAETVREEGV